MSLPFQNTEAVYRSELWACIGSFWSDLFSNRQQVSKLLAAVQKSKIFGQLNSAVNDLAGNFEAASQVTQTTVTFDPQQVIRTGMQLYDDPDNQQFYGTLVSYALTYNFFRIPYFVIKVNGIIPFAIQAPQGKLMIGVDFFVLKDSYIFFRQDPRALFPGSSYVVIAGQDKHYSPFINYLVKADVQLDSDYVVTYLRKYQNPKYLQLALAAVGGLAILREAQTLTAIQTNLTETIYVFETEVQRVNYDHIPLVVGQNYPSDYVIGEGVQIFQAVASHAAWWRQVDWRGGLSLDPVLRDFKGLALLDQPTVAYVAGQDTGSAKGSRVHTRLTLSNNFFAEEPYWQYVGNRETETNAYLNALFNLPEDAGVADPSVLDTYAKLRTAIDGANVVNQQLGLPSEMPDLSALPNSIRTNALDTFFQAVLGTTGFVVLFDSNSLPNPGKMFDFLAQDMLVGGTPLVYAYWPDLAIENIGVGDTITVNDTVTFGSVTQFDLVEVFDLGSAVSDRVYLQAQQPITN